MRSLMLLGYIRDDNNVGKIGIVRQIYFSSPSFTIFCPITACSALEGKKNNLLAGLMNEMML